MRENYTNHEILESIRSGDKAGLTQLYNSIMPSLEKLVVRNGGSRELAKDIFQDAILVIYKKLQTSEITLTSSFSTFFIGICKNLLANQLKKKSSNTVPFSDVTTLIHNGEPEWHELEEQALRARLFYKAMNNLGEDCRHLLELFFQKVPMEEIRDILNYSSYEYVRRRKFLCKNKLTELIKNDPVYKELAPHQKENL